MLRNAEGGDESTRHRAAAAARRVGLIEVRLGHQHEAIAAFAQSRDAYAALADESPANPAYRRGIAVARSDLGHRYRLLGRTHSVSVSAAYGLTKNLSVQIGYEYAITIHDPLQYENHLVDARFVFVY